MLVILKIKMKTPLPGLASVAKQEGKFAAMIIKNKILNNKIKIKFCYKNRGYLATIGRSKAIVDFGWFTLKGKIGWIFWSLIHIYFLIGYRNRFIVFINWIWSYVTFSKGSRLITKIDSKKNYP